MPFVARILLSLLPLIAAPTLAPAGGMEQQVMEPEIVVVYTYEPVVTEPFHSGKYKTGISGAVVGGTIGSDTDSNPITAGAALGGLAGFVGALPGVAATPADLFAHDDRSHEPHVITRSANTDGRVLCLSVPVAKRGGAGLFDLCQP